MYVQQRATRKITAFIACATATVLLTTPASMGNIQYATWVNQSLWSYKIKYMPDFDQRRMPGELPGGGFSFGLPGNGSYYCAPTSSFNSMAYIAQHGFPAVSPGAGTYFHWMGQPPYNDVTLGILELGGEMATGSTTGTSGNGQLEGTRLWLEFYAPGVFDVNLWSLASGFSPDLTHIGGAAINGCLVNLAYGKYENAGELLGLVALGERVGGHVVTFSHGLRWDSAQLLGVRDPADDSANQTQSQFANRYYDVEDRGAFICVGTDCSQSMTFLNYDPDDDYVYMIDSYMTIKPRQGYAFQPTNEMVIYQPLGFTGWYTPPEQFVQIPNEHIVGDIVAMPDGDGFYFLDENAGEIYSINSISGDTTFIAKMGFADQILVGANRLLYVLTEEAQVICINPAATDEPVTDSIFLPSLGNGFAYSDLTNELVIVSYWDNELMFVQNGPDGLGAVQVQPLPVTLELGENVRVAVDPAHVGDTIWVVSTDSSFVYGFRKDVLDSFEAIELEVGGGLSYIDVDDSGRMFVGTEAGSVELLRNGNGDYQLVPPQEMKFPDVAGGAKLFVSRGRSNFDPEIHNAPGWITNIDPDELPAGTTVGDCIADLTDDGVVDAADLATLLGAWGPTAGHVADFNEDGFIDAADLATLLGAWGPCP